MAIEQDEFGTLNSSLELPDSMTVDDERVIRDQEVTEAQAAVSRKQSSTTTRLMLRVLLGVFIALVLIIGSVLIYSHKNESKNASHEIVGQSIDPKETVSSSDQKKGTLTVNGGLNVEGSVQISNGGGTQVLLKPSTSSGETTLTLPATSGLLCLSNNNCNFVTPQNLASSIAVSMAAIVIPPSSLVNGVDGRVTLQGSSSGVSVLTGGDGTISIALAQSLGSSSSPTFSSLLLNGGITVRGGGNFTGSLSQNGNAVCTTVGNCSTNGLTGTGTAGALAYFTSGNTLASSVISQSAGEITVGGNLRVAGNAKLRSSTDSIDALTVQNAAGQNVFEVDTQNLAVRTDTLLPKLPGITVSGSYVPEHYHYNSTATLIADATNKAGADSVAMALGSDGYGRIVYNTYSSDNISQLVYSRCTNIDCTASVNTVIVSDPGGSGFGYAVMEKGPDNLMRIAYEDYGDKGLHLIRCKDDNCSTSTGTLVDGAGEYAGSYGIGIDISATGLVRIAYNKQLAGASYYTYYAACNDLDCTTPVISEIDTNYWGYQVAGLALGSDGYARIVYEDKDTQAFKLARCTDSACSTPVITIVDDNSSGEYPGCQGNIVRIGSDGLPRLLYQDCGIESRVHFVQCLNADCTLRNTQVLEDADSSWQGIEMILASDDTARILYLDKHAESLQLDRCLDQSCATHSMSEVDPLRYAGDSGLAAAIASDGYLRVAYSDKGKTGVKYSRLTAADASLLIPEVIINPSMQPGTSIGLSDAPFGQIYAQGINLQSGGTSSALIINKIGYAGLDPQGDIVNVGDGPIAQFQVNGITRAEINQYGTLTLSGDGKNALADFQVDGHTSVTVDKDGTLVSTPNKDSTGIVVQAATGQTADLQQWRSDSGILIGGVSSSGQLYANATMHSGSSVGQLLLGSNDGIGQMLGIKGLNGSYVLGISDMGAINIGGQYTPSPLTISGSTNIGVVASLVQADFNGDGKVDRAGFRADGKIGVQLGQGGGAFAANKSYSLAAGHSTTNYGNNGGGLFAIDVTGDGILDLVSTADYAGAGCNYPSPDFVPYISVWPGIGSGNFSPAPVLTQVSANLSVWPDCVYSNWAASGDINGDGLSDLLLGDGSADTKTVFINNGNGTFARGGTTSTGWGEATLRDLNADGNADLIVGDYRSFSIAYSNGNGSFAPRKVYSTTYNGGGGSSTTKPIVVDIDKDGDLDIADASVDYESMGSTVTYSSNIIVARNDGAGNFTVEKYKIWSSTEYTGAENMELVDLNGDGNLDVIITGNGRVLFVTGASGGSFGMTTAPISAAGGRYVPRDATAVSDWLGNGGSQVGYVDTSGYFNVISYAGSAGLQVKSVDTNATAAPTAIFQRNASSSTGNLLELKDENGSVLSKFDSSGNLTVNSSVTTGTITANTQLNVSTIYSTGASMGGTGNGLTAKWYNNCTTAGPDCGQPLTATKTTGPVNLLTFGAAEANCSTALPAGVNCTNTSVSMTGYVKADHSDTYTFYCYSDDGCRVWVNGTQIINRWATGQAEATGTISLNAGNWYSIRIEYYQETSGANLSLRWSNNSLAKQVVPADHLSTAAPGGISMNADVAFAGKLQETAVSGSYMNFNATTSNNGAAIINTRKGANIGLRLQGSYNQTANLLNFVDMNGNINASFSSTGAVLTLGRIASSGAVTKGQLKLSDGTTSNRTLTLQTAPLAADSVITIPATGAADTVCLVVLANCGGGGGGGGGGIGGSGSINYTARFIGSYTLGTGVLYDDGAHVGIGSASFGAVNKLTVNANSVVDSKAAVQFNSGAGANTALVLQGTVGQTANLFEAQSSTGTALTYVNSNGSVISSGSVDALSGFAINGSQGSTFSCGNDQLVKNIVTQGGIILGGSCTSAINTANTSNGTNTNNSTISSGNATNGGNSGNTTVTSGTVTGSGNKSGNVIVDVGAATNGATAGSLLLGTANASHISIGNSGSTVEINSSTITVNGTLGYTPSVTDTGEFVCRNTLSQLAGCLDKPIVQGGNTFGAGMVIGTKDVQSLAFITNNATVASFGVSGDATFQNSTNSTAAFRIQDSAGMSLITVDTTNKAVYIGTIGGDMTGTVFVLGARTTAGDPNGTNGAMYYNTTTNRFRCYENNTWVNCTSQSNDTQKANDQVFNTTSYGNVTGLNYAVTAGHTYQLKCSLVASVSNNGGNLSMTGPSGIVRYVATFPKVNDQSSGDTFVTSTDYDDASSATNFRIETSVTGTKLFIMQYDAFLATGANPGVWQLRAKAATATSSMTIYNGSSCNMVMVK